MTTKLLKSLVAFKTVTGDNTEILRAFSWIRKQIATVPVFTEIKEYNGVPSLIITTKKTKTPKLWLVAHMDVVPASESMFKPKETNEKLVGRGVYDMKFAIAAYIQLLLDLKDKVSEYDFGIMLVSDEETGGFNGAKQLVEDNFTSACIFLPDGGENWVLQEAAKGVFSVRFTSRGVTAHGARPWLGENAIESLIDFLTSLRDAFSVEPCGNSEHFHTTLNIGKISGGKASNQVPDSAEATVDIRFVPTTNIPAIKKRILAIRRDFPMIDMEIISEGISYAIDKSNPYFTLFLKILKENDIEEKYLRSHGSSDARFFIEKGIPAILIRPIGGNLHSEAEWIDLKSLEIFYQVLKEFVIETKIR